MKIKTYQNSYIDLDLPDKDGNSDFIALPALIDPHVHFRTPGAEYKENWESGANAAINGGVTTVFDMPNNTPSITTLEILEEKIKLVDTQLAKTDINLHRYFYLGATADNLSEIERCKDKIIAVKLFMGASTGNLLVSDHEIQKKIFEKCAALKIVVAVHAEDDDTINKEKENFPNPTVADHGKIRPNIAAAIAVKKAIDLARSSGVTLYILHCSTAQEIELIRAAKKEGLPIFAETTPHHLFLTQTAYTSLGTKAQMNPPLRSQDDQNALWEAINDGTIDTVGTDHAPHTLQDKTQPYPASPSGVPGIETYLPLLINAHNQGKISLQKLVDITSANARKIFNLPQNNDFVLVDLNEEKTIKNENLKTKCRWSPFDGYTLKGSVKYTILNNKIYKI